MRTIYKYELEVKGVQVLEIPEGAIIRCVQVQFGVPCLWAEVDSRSPKEKRTIEIFGTGHDIPAELRLSYISTFQMDSGALVFHAYERNAATSDQTS